MTRQLKVLVTGGSRGMGKGIATELAQAGHDLLLVAKSQSGLAAASAELGKLTGKAPTYFAADLSDLGEAQKIREYAAKVNFQPDVVIYSAGTFFEESLQDASLDHIRSQFNVNLHAAYLLARAFVDDLSKSSFARVILIGSTAAFEPYAYGPIYGITKWGLRGVAENLRNELREKRIGVSIVHPGGTWTDLWEGADLPRQRLLETSDVARLIAAMLSLNPQAVVDELIVRPIEGDMHD